MFDNDIPVPKKRNKFDLRGIEIGQSKWFEFDPENTESIATLRASIVTSATFANKHIANVKFSTSREKNSEKDGIRIWRIQ